MRSESLAVVGPARPFALDDSRAAWLLLALTLLGAGLRLFHLGAEPLWIDEAFTWRIVQQPLRELWWGPQALLETNPPLYYTVQHLLLPLGDSEALLRLPAALFGTLTIPIAYLLGRRVGGTVTGLMAAALLATSAVHVAFSQEARGYSLLMTAALMAVWGMLEFFRANTDASHWPAEAGREGRGRLGLVAYALGTGIALYCHYTAVFLVFFANVAALVWWLGATGRSRRFAGEWIVANAVLGLLFLFWAPVMVTQALYDPFGSVGWLQQESWGGALVRVARIYGQWFFPLGRPWLGLLLPIPLLALLAVWRWRAHRLLVATLLLFVAGVPLLTWLVGFLGRPLLIERTLLWPLGLWLVLLGAGVALIRSQSTRSVVLALLLGVQLASLAGYYHYGTTRKYPWNDLVATIATAQRPGDGFVVMPLPAHWPFGYYATRLGLPHHDYFVDDGPSTPGYPNIEPSDRSMEFVPPQSLGALRGRHERLWVAFEQEQRYDPERAVRNQLTRMGRIVDERHYDPATAYGPALTLLLVELTPQPGAPLSPPGRGFRRGG
jgi:mannosyltransferase